MQSKARGDCTLLILPSGWFCELAGKGKCVQCAVARILKFLCGGKKIKTRSGGCEFKAVSVGVKFSPVH